MEHKIELIVDFVDRIIVFTPEGRILADGDSSTIFSHYKEKLKQYGIWYPGAWNEYKKESCSTIQCMQHNKLYLESFKGYRNKQLKISLESTTVHSGEWIMVRGENGAGKSTLLLSLMQLIKTSGTYQMNDFTITKINDLYGLAYLVFQNPEFQFLTNSVYDEMTYGLAIDHEITARAEEILTTFGLATKEKHHPYHLSIGQKRRLSVASAFIQHPKVLLLDEPTFGQDSINTFKILEWLENERQKGTIIIMVTHDSKIVQHFGTRLWEVKNGKVVTDCKINGSLRSKEEHLYEYSL
ncbi:ABC transporter ATP-binding protein [Fictibacillus sp. UD]|uniref:ABC transporter ATP-binding protein n=1 Tax=Fictibacillus sp. UD TaxID=3038777 RepID=UPI00374955DF